MLSKHILGRSPDLKRAEESVRNLPFEAFFGFARLWLQELIYYGRKNKGLIWVDNYARRVAQNQEFGIYIRNSSGWGEKGLGKHSELKGFAGYCYFTLKLVEPDTAFTTF